MRDDEIDHSNYTTTSGLPHPRIMVEQILEVVAQMRSRQNAWNEELHRLFLIDAREQQESDRLTAQVHAAELLSRADANFNDWMARRESNSNTNNTNNNNDLVGWYHVEALVSKTPFAALVPCPRGLSSGGRGAVLRALDALGLPHFYIQTVPLHLPLSHLAPSFIASPSHLPAQARASKSTHGVLSYVGHPCRYGTEAMELITEHPMLSAALDRTACLLLNDYIPRAVLCVHCVIVGGLCAAAEVACDVHMAAKLNFEHVEAKSEENEGNSINLLSHALKEFVEKEIVVSLENRSFRALLIGEIIAGKELEFRSNQNPFIPTDIHFSLLNLDTIDGCEFECFTQSDILNVAQKMAGLQKENKPISPILRFLKPPVSE